MEWTRSGLYGITPIFSSWHRGSISRSSSSVHEVEVILHRNKPRPAAAFREELSGPHRGSSEMGVPHGVELKGDELFFSHVRLHGGPAPVRRYPPHLIDLAPG